VLKHEERERKGVELIGSNLPPHLREELAKLMTDIVDEVKAHGQVDLEEKLDRVAQWEHEIVRSVTAGETTYLRTAKINEEEAYGDIEDAVSELLAVGRSLCTEVRAHRATAVLRAEL
jgi:hypothetical protein